MFPDPLQQSQQAQGQTQQRQNGPTAMQRLGAGLKAAGSSRDDNAPGYIPDAGIPGVPQFDWAQYILENQ